MRARQPSLQPGVRSIPPRESAEYPASGTPHSGVSAPTCGRYQSPVPGLLGPCRVRLTRPPRTFGGAAAYAVRVPRAGSPPTAAFPLHPCHAVAVRLGVPTTRVSGGTSTPLVTSRSAFASQLSDVLTDVGAPCPAHTKKGPVISWWRALFSFYLGLVSCRPDTSPSTCPMS